MKGSKQAVMTMGLIATLAFVACGGSSGSSGQSKDAQGVRTAYAEFVKLAKEGKGKEACDRYMTPAAKALADGFGGCEEITKSTASDMATPEQIQAMKVTVTGDKATYELPDDSGKAVYAGDHWRFDVGD